MTGVAFFARQLPRVFKRAGVELAHHCVGCRRPGDNQYAYDARIAIFVRSNPMTVPFSSRSQRESKFLTDANGGSENHAL